MTPTTRHTIYAPAVVAGARMPSVARTPSGVVCLTPATEPSTWQWQVGDASGTVRLTARTVDTAHLEVAPADRASVSAADALAVILYGLLERQWSPPPVVARTGPGRHAQLALVAVAILVPVLAVTGMRVLAPPAPMDVASAVAQFRAQSTAAPGQPTEPDGAGSGRRRPRQSGGARTDAPPQTRNPQGRAGDEDSAGSRPRAEAPADTAAPAGRAAKPPAPARQRDRAPANRTQEATPQRQPSRRQQAPAQQRVVTSPEEGVYRYATSGYESIDRPSSRHDYPRETALSIRATDCGFVARWQPLEDRWDQMTVCRRDGQSFLPFLSTHREFYGQSNDTNYTCSRSNYAYRTEPGATWAGTCADGDAKMEVRGRTIGREPIRVGDETVDTVHYLLEARISGGDAEGTWTAHRWVDPTNGLLVRVEARTNATSQSSVGTVQYQEELSLRLLSTTPQR